MGKQSASWEQSLQKKRKKMSWKPRPPPVKMVIWTASGIAGSLVAIAVVLFIWVSITTGSTVSAANEFLAAASSGKTQEAFASTAALFRQAQDEPRFERELRQLSLQSYGIEPWWQRILKKDRDGYDLLVGSMRTDEIDTVVFSMQMIEEDGVWKVLSFVDRGREDVGPGAWFTQAPDVQFVRALVNETMADFAQAVKEGDYAPFYNGMAETFKVRTPLETFRLAFQYIIDSGIDITGVTALEAKFDGEPKLEVGTVSSMASSGFGRGGGGRGGGGGGGGFRGRGGSGTSFQAQSSGRLLAVLVAEGSFPLETVPVGFKFQYRYSHPGWKVHAMFVDVPGARETAAQ